MELTDIDAAVCPGCGYNLFGIQSDRCPECGLLIDRTILAQSQIPWVHRRKIGRGRAFWRTVVLVNFRPKVLAREMTLPVSFVDAQKFRRVCIAVAWLPLMAWSVGLLGWGDFPAAPWERISAIVVAGFSIGLFLTFVSGIHTYFFHPAALPVVLQNRAVALGYYASAVLAWVWVAALVALPFRFVDTEHMSSGTWDRVFLPIIGAFYGIALLLIFVLWSNALSLLKYLAHASRLRRWMMGLFLPPAWALSAAICLVVIPAIVLFVALVIVSLI